MQVFRVIATVHRGGSANNTFTSHDLIFTDHGPTLVLEWAGEPPEPTVAVRLEPAKLQRVPPSFRADYIYQDPIPNPRVSH